MLNIHIIFKDEYESELEWWSESNDVREFEHKERFRRRSPPKPRTAFPKQSISPLSALVLDPTHTIWLRTLHVFHDAIIGHP